MDCDGKQSNFQISQPLPPAAPPSSQSFSLKLTPPVTNTKTLRRREPQRCADGENDIILIVDTSGSQETVFRLLFRTISLFMYAFLSVVVVVETKEPATPVRA